MRVNKNYIFSGISLQSGGYTRSEEPRPQKILSPAIDGRSKDLLERKFFSFLVLEPMGFIL